MKSFKGMVLFLFFLLSLGTARGTEEVPWEIQRDSVLQDLLGKRYREVMAGRYKIWRNNDESYSSRLNRFAFEYRYKFGTTKSPGKIYEEALQQLTETREKMEFLALKIEPKKTFDQFLEDFKNQCPKNSKELLELYKKEIDRAKNFVTQKDLVTVPPYARKVSVKLGNPDSRFAFGFFQRPRRPGDTGYFIVIPPSPKESKADQMQRLRSHNKYWATVVSAHEAVPGHHLQLSLTLKNSGRLQRYFFNPAFVEGWGLYCEEMLFEEGYYKDPNTRFAQLQMQAWRAARVVVDQGLYLGLLTKKEATDLLVYTVGMEPLAASLEVEKQARRPFYYSGYFTGYMEILRLREKAKKTLGKKFNLKWFHDTLLSMGPIPLDIIEKVFDRDLKNALAPKKPTKRNGKFY